MLVPSAKEFYSLLPHLGKIQSIFWCRCQFQATDVGTVWKKKKVKAVIIKMLQEAILTKILLALSVIERDRLKSPAMTVVLSILQ